MINLRDKNQALPSGLLIAALLIAIGTVLYISFVPVPTPDKVAKDTKTATNKDEATIKRQETNWRQELDTVRAYAFNGQEQDADSTILALVTNLTGKCNLKLVGFRPQKPVDAGQLTQLPYIVSVSGRFPDVVAFTYDLEAKGTKLAVNTVQMAASDTSTDVVTGNISVVGYLNQPFQSGAQNG